MYHQALQYNLAKSRFLLQCLYLHGKLLALEMRWHIKHYLTELACAWTMQHFGQSKLPQGNSVGVLNLNSWLLSRITY